MITPNNIFLQPDGVNRFISNLAFFFSQNLKFE